MNIYNIIKFEINRKVPKRPMSGKILTFEKEILIEQIQKYFSKSVNNARHRGKLKLVKNKLL